MLQVAQHESFKNVVNTHVALIVKVFSLKTFSGNISEHFKLLKSTTIRWRYSIGSEFREKPYYRDAE